MLVSVFKFRINPLFGALFTLITVPCLSPAFGQYQIGELGVTEPDFRRDMVIPPSPEAQAFAKYGNTPVSLYTGTPQINIPIWQYAGAEMQYPISLSYHASGIKVEEKASWVGLGWNLNATGSISRSVHGYPDEGQTGQIRSLYSEYANLEKYLAGEPTCPNQSGRFDNIYQYRYFEQDISNFTNLIYETQPDIYYYNFGGYSGKLYFDSQQRPHTVGWEPFRISVTKSGLAITSFIVITEDGTTYRFANTETTEVQGDEPDSYNYLSNWYLSSITSPNGLDQVLFSYRPAITVNEKTNFGRQEVRRVVLSSDLKCNNKGYQYSTPEVPVIHTMLYLDRITCQKFGRVEAVVEFISTDDREDFLIGGRKLNEIRIKNGDNELLKSFVFQYGYFGNVGAAETSLRLKLLSVQEFGHFDTVTPVNKPPHLFSYSETDGLPGRFSNAIDHWGFFGDNSGSLIPEIDNYGGNRGMDIPGGNRNPTTQLSRAKAGILEKVTYPTGGYTVYTYENHRSKDNYQSVPWIEGDYGISLRGGYNGPHNPYTKDNDSGYPDEYFRVEEFTIPLGAKDISAYFKATSSSVCGGNQAPCVEKGHEGFYILKGGGIPLFQVPDTPTGTIYDYYAFTRLADKPNFPVDQRVLDLTTEFTPGNTYWVLIINGNPEITATFNITWINRKEPTFQEQLQGYLVGGLRVSKIEDYDGINTAPALTRRYSYTNEDRRSSGIVFSNVTYTKSTSQTFYDLDGNIQEQIPPYTCSYLDLRADPVGTLANVHGSHIGYSRVVEKVVDQSRGANGSTIYEYHNGQITTNRYGPSTPASGLYGKVLVKKVKNREGDLLQETHYQYEGQIDLNASITGLSLEPRFSYTQFHCYYDDNGCQKEREATTFLEQQGCDIVRQWTAEYKKYIYRYHAIRMFLVKDSTFVYAPQISGPNNFNLTVRSYQYDNDLHRQLTQVEVHNSNGDQIQTEYRYAHDYMDITTGYIAELRAKGVRNALLEQKQWSNSDLVGHQKFEYLMNGTIAATGSERVQLSSRYYLPVQIPISNPTLTSPNDFNSYTQNIALEYYTDGRVKRSTPRDGSVVTYLWDDTNLIAEVTTSSSQDSFSYSNFERSGTHNGWSYNPADVATASPYFGSKYLTGNASTLVRNNEYIVSFWAKTSGNKNIEIHNNAGLLETIAISGSTWNRYTVPIAITSTSDLVTLVNAQGVLVDELRIIPKDGGMVTFDIEPLIGIQLQLDENNIPVFFEYDGLGRLVLTRDLDKNILEKYEYTYQQP